MVSRRWVTGCSEPPPCPRAAATTVAANATAAETTAPSPIPQHAIQEAEIGELEALVSGVNQISQSTLLLKKKKEMHEVDDSLDFMKGEYKTRMEACDERQREFERRQSEMKEQVRRE